MFMNNTPTIIIFSTHFLWIWVSPLISIYVFLTFPLSLALLQMPSAIFLFSFSMILVIWSSRYNFGLYILSYSVRFDSLKFYLEWRMSCTVLFPSIYFLKMLSVVPIQRTSTYESHTFETRNIHINMFQTPTQKIHMDKLNFFVWIFSIWRLNTCAAFVVCNNFFVEIYVCS